MGTDISCEIDGRTCLGYLADGSKGKPAPGVLVIHEGTGLGANARSKADRLAASGHVAFAMDLFGVPIESREHGISLMRKLAQDWPELRARLKTGLEALRRQPNVDPKRLAAIGFCFGGTSAIELGRTGADLKAIVGFHSGLTNPHPEDTKNIKARVLVCIGDSDPLIPADARDGFMRNMTESRIDCQMLLFSGIGHSFTNREVDQQNMPGFRYDANAERRSWAAMESLFAEEFA